MTKVPYIGITDFTKYDQVLKMLEVFNSSRRFGLFRRLHVGVMMSYKTLNGLETQWSSIFPKKEEISGIFSSDSPRVMNCLHFADYENNPNLAETLCRAIGYGGMGVNALQLDMIWPEPAEISNAVHGSRKRLEVILQVGRDAFDQVGDDPAALVERLEDYAEVVDFVLLDKSGGKGLGMNGLKMIPFVRAIKENFPDLGIAVAGGLGPDTMYLAEPLIKEFPDISLDAQGRLRPSGDAHDPIDWHMAKKYPIKALKMFQRASMFKR